MSRKIWLQSLLKLWPIRLCKLHLRSLRVRWVCVSWELLGLCQISPTERVETRQKSDPAGKCFAKRNWINITCDWFISDDLEMYDRKRHRLEKLKNTCIQSLTIDESILGHGVRRPLSVLSAQATEESNFSRVENHPSPSWTLRVGQMSCSELDHFFNFLKTMVVL